MIQSCRTFLILIIALAAPAAFAQLLTFKQILDRPDRPQPDQKIAYGNDAHQYGELWLPKGKGPYPVVLMIHGGCWLAELPGPELLAFQADELRAKGVAVWSITYRRLGHDGGGYPGTFLDVANGADKLRDIAEKYALDLNRVVATGHSAGGHLALWAAARPKIAEGSALHMAKPLPIKAVVAVAGVTDLAYAGNFIAPACGEKTIEKLVDLEKRGKEAVWKDTSPVELLPTGVKQTLIHGIYDVIVPPVHGYRLRLRAAAKGEAVEIVNIDNAGHFELISPWTPAGREVVGRIFAALGDKP